MKTLIGIVLLLLGMYMIYFGINKSLLPPAITGIGFILIVILFYLYREKLN